MSKSKAIIEGAFDAAPQEGDEQFLKTAKRAAEQVQGSSKRRRNTQKTEGSEYGTDNDVKTDDESKADDGAEASGTEKKVAKIGDVARGPAKTAQKKKIKPPPPPGATRFLRVLRRYEEADEICGKLESDYDAGLQKFVYAEMRRFTRAVAAQFHRRFSVLEKKQYDLVAQRGYGIGVGGNDDDVI